MSVKNETMRRNTKIFYVEGFFKKLLIVIVWIVIALGVYQCSVQLSDREPKADKAQEGGQGIRNIPKENSKAADREYVQKIPFDENVRILLMNQGFRGIYHTKLQITCSEGMTAIQDNEQTDFAQGSELILSAADAQEGQMIRIAGKNGGRLEIKNMGRNAPALYRGTLECYVTSQGIVVVNELPVEAYLYSVVPSEMPSTYPDEALKAQAVCARTYTYFHKQSYAYPEWRAHMDDSTAFQVYMNCQETQRAVDAVDATKNQVLTFEGEIVESFYYSTSSGYNGGARVWSDTASAAERYLIETGKDIYAAGSEEGEQAYQQYIDSGDAADVEYQEAWYRWNYDRPLEGEALKHFLQNLCDLSKSQPDMVKIRSRYQSSDQLVCENGIKDIRILSRERSGMAAQIMIETEQFRVSVTSQHAIRQALGCAQDVVTKKDGSSYIMGEILPSAYFYIEKIFDKNGESGDTLKQIRIHGAGFGHGCGMSQNGAKGLAERGLTAAQILAYYYNGEIQDVSGLRRMAS